MVSFARMTSPSLTNDTVASAEDIQLLKKGLGRIRITTTFDKIEEK